MLAQRATAMTPDEAFIQAIREQPDDDAPRLIYADWLDEHDQSDRAEFIRVQCEGARLPRSDPRRGPLGQRAEHLLECHWEDWGGSLRRAIGKRWDRMGNLWLAPRFNREALDCFRRGFVDALGVEVATLLSHPNPFSTLAPLRHLCLWQTDVGLKSLAASPYLAQVQSLAFLDRYCSPVTDGELRALAESPHLGRLNCLFLAHNNITDAGLDFLSKARWLTGLRQLILTGNAVTHCGIECLLDAPFPPRLRHLLLGSNALGNRGVEALARSPLLQDLQELGLTNTGITDQAVDALLASPYLLHLTTLELGGNDISPRAQARLRLSSLGSQLTRLNL